MDLEQIKTALNDSNPQQRMRAIRELRNFEADLAVPLLLEHTNDSEFLVRSYVAMGLGKKKSDRAYDALLEMTKNDSDPNVRAEAANSLSYYGDVAIAPLRKMYQEDDHWLVRRSIIAAMADLNSPQELLEICAIGISGDDQPVMESCISCLGLLADTEQQPEALKLLFSLAEDESWRIRLQVAKALGKYDTPEAMAAIDRFKTDEDHRVIGAALESMV